MIKVFVDKRHRELLATMRKEIDISTTKIVQEHLRVPELIGEFCPYSTFANFMASFHRSSTSNMVEHSTKIISLQNLTE